MNGDARERLGLESELWAVCCYFNPAGWRSRRRNYRAFRRHLELPLLTVELTFGRSPELGADDAEVYLRVDGGDVMWQKERLLNLGIAALPPHVTHVAWLDADVVFTRRGWWREALAALDRLPVLQPFERVVHLDLASSAALAEGASTGVAAGGIVELAAAELLAASACGPGIWRQLAVRHRRIAGRPVAAKGIAWMARRELVAGLGLFDRCILGGGDSAVLAGFLADGESFLDDASSARRRGLGRAYAPWAAAAADAVGGRIGSAPGTVLHLWHGAFDERRYDDRYGLLERYGFDLERDLRHDGGAWRWATSKPAFHRAVADYFRERREDDAPSEDDDLVAVAGSGGRDA